jgi:hypothetical protein
MIKPPKTISPRRGGRWLDPHLITMPVLEGSANREVGSHCLFSVNHSDLAIQVGPLEHVHTFVELHDGGQGRSDSQCVEVGLS